MDSSGKKQGSAQDTMKRLKLKTKLTDEELEMIDNDDNDYGLENISGISLASSMTPDFQRIGGANSDETNFMRQELKRKDLQIESQKKQHAIQLTSLESQIEEAKHDKRMSELRLEQEIRKFEEKTAALQESTHKELRSLREWQSEIENQNPIIRERLASLKKDIGDLESVSEARYIEVKAIPVEMQSVREFLQCRIYEKESERKKEMEKLRKLKERLEEGLKASQVEEDKAKRQLERITRNNSDVERDLRMEISILQQRAERLESELSQSLRQTQELQAKGELYDKYKSKCDTNDSSVSSMAKQLEESDARMRQLTLESKSNEERAKELQHEIERLKLEQDHQTKQFEIVKEERNRYKDELETSTSRVTELATAREELYQQLLTTADEHRVGYDDRLRQQITAISEETRKDLDRIRQDSHSAHERELKMLVVSRDVALSEAKELRVKIDEVTGRSLDVERELRSLQASSDARLSEVLGQLRLKTFELERTKIAREESSATHKAGILEIESLRSKVDVLTREYYVLQRDTAARIAALESETAVSNTKLKQYEALEGELDNALLLAGQLDNADGTSTAILNHLSSAVPTSSARRMEQAAKLSKKVVELGKDKMLLSQELAETKARLESLEKDLEESRDLLQQTKQPYGYFVDSIMDKDKEIGQLRKRLTEFDEAQKEWTNEKNTLLADLQRLCNVRSELEDVRDTLVLMKGTSVPNKNPAVERLRQDSPRRSSKQSSPSKPRSGSVDVRSSRSGSKSASGGISALITVRK